MTEKTTFVNGVSRRAASDWGLKLCEMISNAGIATPTLDRIQDIAEALLETKLMCAKKIVRENWEQIQYEYPKIAFFLMQHELDEQ